MDPAAPPEPDRAPADPATHRAARNAALCLAGAGVDLARRHVLALCSGGIDSIVLVAVLARLPRGARPAHLTVAWLDHGTRTGDDVIAARLAARDAASAAGAAFVEVAAPAGAVSGAQPGGLQASARAWRYGAAMDLAAKCGADVIATGHTASDQLETVLIGMAADAGDGGIGGMPVVRQLQAPAPGAGAAASDPILLVRPLLGIDRMMVEAVAGELGLDWSEDPTNADVEQFQRNRIRHEVVPSLLVAWPSAGVAIGRRAARHATDREAREALAGALLDAWVDDAGALDARQLATLAGPARAELIATWLRRAEIGRDLSSRLVDSVVALADVGEERSGRSGTSVSLPRGACVRRDGYSLSIVLPPGAPAPDSGDAP